MVLWRLGLDGKTADMVSSNYELVSSICSVEDVGFYFRRSSCTKSMGLLALRVCILYISIPFMGYFDGINSELKCFHVQLLG